MRLVDFQQEADGNDERFSLSNASLLHPLHQFLLTGLAIRMITVHHRFHQNNIALCHLVNIMQCVMGSGQ